MRSSILVVAWPYPPCGSAAKLKCTPFWLAENGALLSENAADIAPSTAPAIAWPELCASILLPSICSARSFTLSTGGPTVWVRTPDVLGALLRSPAYAAVMEWLPTESVDVVKPATPPTTATAPSTVDPSLKVTVPVGLMPATVAVKVTACPPLLGLAEDTSPVAVRPATARTPLAPLPGLPSLQPTIYPAL